MRQVTNISSCSLFWLKVNLIRLFIIKEIHLYIWCKFQSIFLLQKLELYIKQSVYISIFYHIVIENKTSITKFYYFTRI